MGRGTKNWVPKNLDDINVTYTMYYSCTVKKTFSFERTPSGPSLSSLIKFSANSEVNKKSSKVKLLMKGLCLSMINSHFGSKLISVYMFGGGGGVERRMFWCAFSKKKKKKNGCRQRFILFILDFRVHVPLNLYHSDSCITRLSTWWVIRVSRTTGRSTWWVNGV